LSGGGRAPTSAGMPRNRQNPSFAALLVGRPPVAASARRPRRAPARVFALPTLPREIPLTASGPVREPLAARCPLYFAATPPPPMEFGFLSHVVQVGVAGPRPPPPGLTDKKAREMRTPPPSQSDASPVPMRGRTMQLLSSRARDGPVVPLATQRVLRVLRGLEQQSLLDQQAAVCAPLPRRVRVQELAAGSARAAPASPSPRTSSQPPR